MGVKISTYLLNYICLKKLTDDKYFYFMIQRNEMFQVTQAREQSKMSYEVTLFNKHVTAVS